MINSIKEKLQIELNSKIQGEPQVVYTLSRVRKILEIEEKEDEYPKLKFYCDWALHPKINNVKAVREILEGIIARKGEAGADLTLKFETFHQDLKKFLEENSLTTNIYDTDDNKFYFEMYLSQIYADTPLIVDKKIKISWLGQTGDKSFGGSFKIEDITLPVKIDKAELIA